MFLYLCTGSQWIWMYVFLWVVVSNSFAGPLRTWYGTCKNEVHLLPRVDLPPTGLHLEKLRIRQLPELPKSWSPILQKCPAAKQQMRGLTGRPLLLWPIAGGNPYPLPEPPWAPPGPAPTPDSHAPAPAPTVCILCGGASKWSFLLSSFSSETAV